jgi:saccharopine dehydrogenase-like NADP-dependent oxidoreductase
MSASSEEQAPIPTGMTKSSSNKYVVLGGGGAMGRAVARDLYESSAEARILVADLNLEAVRATARSLGQGADPGGRVEARQVDVRDTTAMAGLLKGRDVVINASNYYWNVQVMRAALEAGTHYLDLGGLFHTTRKQLELDGAFRDRDLLAVLGIGSAPGIMNVLARYAGDRLERVRAIRIYNGVVDRAPSASVLSVGYSLLTILDEGMLNPVVFERGEFREVPTFSGQETVNFPEPVGSVTVHLAIHSEVATLPLTYRSKGIQECFFKINYDPVLLQRLRFLISLGMASTDPVEVRGQKIVPRDLLLALVAALPQSDAPPDDHEVLRVVVSGEEKGRPVTYTLDAFADADPKRGLSAVAVDTGVPPSVVAQMAARGDIRERGVHPPETCVEPATFFAEIGRRGMRVSVNREEPLGRA